MHSELKVVRNTTRFIYVSDQRPVSSWHEAPHRATEQVGWRMIAANNRAIAKSVETFGSLAECGAAVRALSVDVDALVASVLFSELDASWWWTVSRDEVAVGRCVYPAKRRLEAVRAVGQFLEILRSVPDGPLVVRQLGLYAHGRERDRSPNADRRRR